MNPMITIAGISGSLRKDSYNTMLLHAAKELLPEGVQMNVLSIAELPLYNGDYDLPIASERPPAVTSFREELAKVDGLLIVSPEYNYSIPGGLKNAIDWASRGDGSPLFNKPVSLMGATISMWGTVRMQVAFNSVFQIMSMKPVYRPEVAVAKAHEKFDGNGKFTDEYAKTLIRQNLENLKELILLYKK